MGERKREIREVCHVAFIVNWGRKQVGNRSTIQYVRSDSLGLTAKCEIKLNKSKQYILEEL